MKKYFTKVRCKDCGSEWDKRTYSIKKWQGRCKFCAQKFELSKPERKKISIKNGLDVYKRYGIVAMGKRRGLKGKDNPRWKGGISLSYKKTLVPRPKPENCEICNKHFSEMKKGICFDHCHITGEFRGWICGECNLTLGLVNDSINRLKLLIKYLKQFK